MGLLGFLGGLAADTAKDYVSKRGIDGIMEDAGNLKSRVTAKERRLLDRLAKSLGLSSERATQIEQLVN